MPEIKSLKTVRKAMRSIMFSEENRGLNRAIRKQWGFINVVKTLKRTMQTGGFKNNMDAVKRFQMGSIAANFFICLWEVLDQREAIVDGDRRFTFSQMRDRVLRLANSFQAMGIEPKDRIACMLYNSAEYFETFYAATIIGAPLPAVNWHLSGKSLRDTVTLRKPKIFVFDHDFAGEILPFKDDMTTVEHFVMVGGDPPKDILSYDNMISQHNPGIPRTKTGVITLLLPKDYMKKSERINSVGKPRCEGLLIYDEIEKKPVETGKEGLVLCRSVGTLSLRYPGTKNKLKDSQVMIDGKEWYDDRLIGWQDKDGFLYLTGRLKEMIICGGVNIFPVEIERVLFMNPKIEDAAVIRAPHPDLGEMPLACIQLKNDVSAAEQEIQGYCKEKGLKGFNIPKKVDFYDKLPRHIDGKLIKRELEEKYWKGMAQRG